MLSTFLILVWTTVLVDIQKNPSVQDATSRRGELVSMDEDSIILRIDGNLESIAIDGVAAIVPVDAVAKQSPDRTVRLRNGSVLRADEVTADQNRLGIKLRRIDNIELPIERAASLRLRRPQPTVDSIWLGYLAEQTAADRLVIRRGGDVLDVVEGVILEMDSESVQFDIDGQTVAAPLNKLEGVIWSSQTNSEKDASGAARWTVQDVYGSKFRSDSVSIDNDEVRVTLAGQTFAMSIDNLRRIGAVGNTVSLQDLRPVQLTVAMSPLSKLAPATVEAFFGPVTGSEPTAGFGSGGPNGSGDSSPWTMSVGTTAEYRVTPGMTQLTGSCRRPDKVVATTPITIEVLVDGRSAMRQSIPSDRDATVGFEVDLQSARRVTLLVDGDASLLGGRVQWSDVRLSR